MNLNEILMRLRRCFQLSALLFFLGCLVTKCIAQPISNQFRPSELTQEQISWRHESNGVRGLILAPQQLERNRRCLVIFATPNGNTLEQTLGCRASEKVDWRYDIQHVAAQIRWLRNQDTSTDYILAVVQAPQVSWPEFRRTTADSSRWISEFVESIKKEVSAHEVVLACHSGSHPIAGPSKSRKQNFAHGLGGRDQWPSGRNGTRKKRDGPWDSIGRTSIV